jgi:RNA polymerase sigma-70 factor (ECF subfamily)
LPPSALELHDGEVAWAEESAVFELPAPRPGRDDAAPERSLREPALESRPASPPEATAVGGAAPLGAPIQGLPLEGPPLEEAPALDDVGRLFNDYRAYVAKIGRRILGPTSEVDDLIQDVFLATVRDAHKIKDPARLAAWLGTVTTRMAKRRRFRSSLQPIASDGLDDLVDRARDEGPGPESSADLSGNIRKLLSLPDELRTPWLLKHVEGRTLEDVARQCDCSLSTAARRIQSASSKLGRGR